MMMCSEWFISTVLEPVLLVTCTHIIIIIIIIIILSYMFLNGRSTAYV